MSGPVKRQPIVEAVNRLKAKITEWEKLPLNQTPTTVWQGRAAKVVSQAIQESASELFELVNTQSIEQAAWPLVLAIDAFDDAFDEWARGCQFQQDKTDPSGSAKLWGVWNTLLGELPGRGFKPPEPMEQLVRNEVNAKTIARIYGWYDEHGNPDVTKVQEEIATPGTHYNPKTWVHPSQKRLLAEMEAKWAVRAERIGKKATVGRAAEPRQFKAAAESIEDLIRNGINAKQIAKMHWPEVSAAIGATERNEATLEAGARYVSDLAEQMGIPIGGNATAAVMRKRANESAAVEEEREIERKAEQMRVDGINAYPELGDDQTSRIFAMHSDGVKPGDIAKALSKSFPNLTFNKVTKILRSEAAKAS